MEHSSRQLVSAAEWMANEVVRFDTIEFVVCSYSIVPMTACLVIRVHYDLWCVMWVAAWKESRLVMIGHDCVDCLLYRKGGVGEGEGCKLLYVWYFDTTVNTGRHWCGHYVELSVLGYVIVVSSCLCGGFSLCVNLTFLTLSLYHLYACSERKSFLLLDSIAVLTRNFTAKGDRASVCRILNSLSLRY
jgi:hypothetical protein